VDLTRRLRLLGVRAAAATPAAEVAPIVQKDLRFQPYVTAVPLGATVRFVNRDRFDHHVKSVAGGPLGSIAPAKEFEFRLPKPRAGNETSAELKMDAAGSIGLGCHLHGSMRGHLFVSPTPWVAVTDAAGRAVLPGRARRPRRPAPVAPRPAGGAGQRAHHRQPAPPRRRQAELRAAPPARAAAKGEYDN
jgi:plastocyanin